MFSSFVKGFKNQAAQHQLNYFDVLKVLVKGAAIISAGLVSTLAILPLVKSFNLNKNIFFENNCELLIVGVEDFLMLTFSISLELEKIHLLCIPLSCTYHGFREMLHQSDVAKITLPQEMNAKPTLTSRLEAINYDGMQEQDPFKKMILNLIEDPIYYTIMNHPVALNTGIVLDLATLKELMSESYNIQLHCPITQKKITGCNTAFIIKQTAERFVEVLEEEHKKNKQLNKVEDIPLRPVSHPFFDKKVNLTSEDKISKINRPGKN